MEVNGWQLYGHRLFVDQARKLVADVKALQNNDPIGYGSHPKAKFLATLYRLIAQTIPADPSAPEFRQGKTLGAANKHWFRAKFHGRYRLFFRFSTQHRVIIYVWINDDRTLRQAGARTDPYAVFQSMLKRGDPPQGFEQLLEGAIALKKMLEGEG